MAGRDGAKSALEWATMPAIDSGGPSMNIFEATRSYETWLSRLTPLVKSDLQLKHRQMREDLFSFLRGTYYRWAQLWPKTCPALAKDAVALAVGDLHVENFGTWRDVDGRLVWGVNDFDEVHPLPFSNDLVRLAVSAWLAEEGGELAIAPDAACAAIVEGYRACLRAGGRPLVLADSSSPLRTMARDRLDQPERLWNKLHSHPPERKPVPREAARAIEAILPARGITLRFVHRVAGMGSLGKERFTGVGTWQGGQIAREAKVLTASACRWAEGKKDGKIRYEKMIRRAVRCPDPLVQVHGKWLVRRLSPDCFRIPLSHLPKKRNERDLLYWMGWETANVHLGSVSAKKLAKQLKQKPADWLKQAAAAMTKATKQDWKDWRGKK
jgi:hypothetical protein